MVLAFIVFVASLTSGAKSCCNANEYGVLLLLVTPTIRWEMGDGARSRFLCVIYLSIASQ